MNAPSSVEPSPERPEASTLSAPLTILPKPERVPYRKVLDARRTPIRGLWQRKERFYAQIRVPGKRSAARIVLHDPFGLPVRTIAQAQVALQELRAKRRNDSLPVFGRSLTLGESIEKYVAWLRRAGTKSPLTIAKEAGTLTKWNECLGFLRLRQIQRSHINEFVARRKEAEKVSNRTVNLDVVALNNCLRHARDEGHLSRLPTETWKPLAHASPRRPLWTAEQIELVCQKARERGDDGQVLVDYLRFLAFSGARRSEALAVEWPQVDFDRRLLTFNTTKYGRPRNIDLNPGLEAHLKDMLARRQSSKWLFPCKNSDTEIDAAATKLAGNLEAARTAAGLPDFCFHDLRHYFISSCVMAGIDYMTIAKWVGHRDGGVMIGRVYGHLNDAHAKRMAAKLTLF